ncbi:hypothetical protein TNCV_3952911 [Trichonephila clavipes]|nr:hypothetical protein TNCV_3952911 [Trichonephila clavipes]
MASVFMVHQISYSIFEVGGEAIPVMLLREKRKIQERQICWFLIEEDVKEPEGECNEWQKDDTRAPSSGRRDTYRVSLPPRWRADVPMSARANTLEFVLY